MELEQVRPAGGSCNYAYLAPPQTGDHAASDPLRNFDETLARVAEDIGAGKPESVTTGLSHADQAALANALALVGTLRVTHTINTSGDVLVPVDDGAYTIVISPTLLAGEEWLSLQMFLRIEVPDDLTPNSQVRAFCSETNLYYGPKCVSAGGSIQLIHDVPASGLTPEVPDLAMRRIAWVLGEIRDEVPRLPGTHPPTVFGKPFKVERSVTADGISARRSD